MRPEATITFWSTMTPGRSIGITFAWTKAIVSRGASGAPATTATPLEASGNARVAPESVTLKAVRPPRTETVIRLFTIT